MQFLGGQTTAYVGFTGAIDPMTARDVALEKTIDLQVALAIRNRKHGRPKHVATLHLDYRKYYAACDGLICIAAWQRAGIPESFNGGVAVVELGQSPARPWCDRYGTGAERHLRVKHTPKNASFLFDRDKRFVLFGLAHDQVSWRGVGLLALVFFGSLVVAAVLMPFAYWAVEWWSPQAAH